jgi:hypothetical protein
MKFIFTKHLNAFVFKHNFDHKNYKFWKCVFNKNKSHFLCDKEHGCTIYVMYNQGTIFKKINAYICELCVKM